METYVGKNVEVLRLQAAIKKLCIFLSGCVSCSQGRPVDTLLASAEETASKLKTNGTADYPRIAKLFGQIKWL